MTTGTLALVATTRAPELGAQVACLARKQPACQSTNACVASFRGGADALVAADLPIGSDDDNCF